MMILITMTGWLYVYCLYIGKSHVSAVMLLDFRQKYMNIWAYDMYMWMWIQIVCE